MPKYGSLDSFVTNAEKNEKYVYHRGFLMSDIDDPAYTAKTRDSFKKTSKQVWDWYLKGFITLVQKKLDDSCFEYIAIRTMGVGARPDPYLIATSEPDLIATSELKL